MIDLGAALLERAIVLVLGALERFSDGMRRGLDAHIVGAKA
jgi:hypothetical protein